MVRRLISTLLFASLLPLPVMAAEDTYADIPEEIQTRIFRPCKRVDDSDRPRCMAREARIWRDREKVKLPHEDYEFRDAQDFGQGRLREQLQAERLKKFRQKASTRKTYRQFTPTDDPNTRKRPYINDIRAERLRCMLLPKGRPRSMCMDQLANDARKKMQAQSGSRRYPAQ